MVITHERINDKVITLYKKYMNNEEEEYVNFVNSHSRNTLYLTIKKTVEYEKDRKKNKTSNYFHYLKSINDKGYPKLHWLIFKEFSV